MHFVVLVPSLPPLEGGTCLGMGLSFATAWIVTANMLRSPTKLTSRLLTYLYIILQHSAGLEQSHHPLAIGLFQCLHSCSSASLFPSRRVHSCPLNPALHFNHIGPEAGGPQREAPRRWFFHAHVCTAFGMPPGEHSPSRLQALHPSHRRWTYVKMKGPGAPETPSCVFGKEGKAPKGGDRNACTLFFQPWQVYSLHICLS
jgi:hypothetical protein